MSGRDVVLTAVCGLLHVAIGAVGFWNYSHSGNVWNLMGAVYLTALGACWIFSMAPRPWWADQ